MQRRWWVALVVPILTVAIGSVSVPDAGAATVSGSPAVARHPIDRVLILSLPGVTWRDVVSHRTPHLRRLLDGAAIADLSTRAPKLRNRLADNYASLGAGDKATGASAASDAAGMQPAGASFGVDELLGTTTAGSVFTRRTGHAHPHLRAAVANYTALLQGLGRSDPEIQAELKKLGVDQP